MDMISPAEVDDAHAASKADVADDDVDEEVAWVGGGVSSCTSP